MHNKGIIISILLFTSACAIGPKIDVGPGNLLFDTWGWNIGAGDLLNPKTASCRLGVYLDELVTRGYAKQIRIIYTPSIGPFVLQYWIPVIRAKGFRVLPILYQSKDDAGLDQQRNWILTGLSAIADLLDGVQVANEVDREKYNDFTPIEYRVFHQHVSAAVRSILPKIPIIGPDIQSTKSSVKFITATGLQYGIDYDVANIHITGIDSLTDIQQYIRNVRQLTGQQTPHVWITEGDWGQTDIMSREGLMPERTYVYVWNCNPDHPFQKGCSTQTRRPGGALVTSCE